MKLKSAARWLCLSLVFLTILSWSRDNGTAADFIPREPDYQDASQWYIKEKGGEADLFYIVSTETVDFSVDGAICHHADTYNTKMCWGILKEMRAVDSLFGGDCNYYSPYYRQATMQSWATESLAMARLPIAIADVVRSWDYYLTHFNQGRPFVLAGFSQGAHGLLEILKRMPDSISSRMVAAYAIGYKITQAQLDSFPILKPAQGATDLGVVINYNSVRSPECAIPIVSGGNVVCINPVNWRTDTVAAQFGDTLTARCDPESHLVIVDGYHERRVMPVIGRSGNYHHRELKFYYPYIRQNIADRVRAFFESAAKE